MDPFDLFVCLLMRVAVNRAYSVVIWVPASVLRLVLVCLVLGPYNVFVIVATVCTHSPVTLVEPLTRRSAGRLRSVPVQILV